MLHCSLVGLVLVQQIWRYGTFRNNPRRDLSDPSTGYASQSAEYTLGEVDQEK